MVSVVALGKLTGTVLPVFSSVRYEASSGCWMAVSCPPPPGAMMASARTFLPLPSSTPAPSMYQPRSLMSPVIFRSMRSKVSRGDRELDDVGARIGLGNAFAVGRLGEEGGPADLLQVDLAVGVDLARRVDHAGRARGALLVGRQPALHLRVDALEAGRVFLAGAPAGLELLVGELATW
jgi:hypothetical protein